MDDTAGTTVDQMTAAQRAEFWQREAERYRDALTAVEASVAAALRVAGIEKAQVG